MRVGLWVTLTDKIIFVFANFIRKYLKMSAAVEIDQTLKTSIKLLHSHKSDSAEKIRLVLDELIKQKHGSSKMLINTMSKKHLAEEKTSPGSNLIVRKQKHVERKLSVSSTRKPVHICNQLYNSHFF